MRAPAPGGRIDRFLRGGDAGVAPERRQDKARGQGRQRLRNPAGDCDVSALRRPARNLRSDPHRDFVARSVLGRIGAVTDGSDGRMVGLFVALLAITAVSFGFAAARKRA